jgi:hypothetical protein
MGMAWSYVGLLAAGLTEVIIRTQPFGSREGTIWATVLATSLVSVVGAIVIRRNRPKAHPEVGSVVLHLEREP